MRVCHPSEIFTVMRGLGPRIHVFAAIQDVDGRAKPGHDDRVRRAGLA